MRRLAQTAAVSLLLFGSPAFSGEDSLSSLPHGVWLSDGYGYVVNVTANNIQTFDISSAGCVRGDDYLVDPFHAFYGRPELEGQGQFVLNRYPTRDRLRQLDALPDACLRPVAGPDREQNLAVFASTFAELYPFFDARGVDWDRQVLNARSDSRDDLFQLLTDMVAPLGDGHVSIEAEDQTLSSDAVVAPGLAPDGQAWSWRSIRASMREYLQSDDGPMDAPVSVTANRRVLYGRLPDGIGYIAPLAMGAWAENQTEETTAAEQVVAVAQVLDAILEELGPLRGMIIDLRANSGGLDAVSMEIVSRFAHARTLAFRKSAARGDLYDVYVAPSASIRFEQPIAVLVGPNTVSAGETAALAFAALPQGRLFGQATRGILSDAIPKTLPNGWRFTLSVETHVAPDGTPVEVQGVQPDLVTPSPASSAPEDMWGRDFGIAVDWLNSAESSACGSESC
jgi:hypothetical protein